MDKYRIEYEDGSTQDVEGKSIVDVLENYASDAIKSIIKED